MKMPRLTVVSLVLNAILLALLLRLAWRPPPASPAAPRVEVVERRVEVPAPPPEPFDWRTVESENYRDYVANLRAIGCPEQTVRDIIVADVNALFTARRQTLLTPEPSVEFWKADVSPVFRPAPGEQLRAQFDALRQLAAEKRRVLHELLGIDVPERSDEVLSAQLLGFLSTDKRLQVEALERRYSHRLMQRASTESGAEQLGNYKKLQMEKRDELKSLLTPEEFEEYELRFSAAAVNLRVRLAALEPSESEFRELVKLRQSYEDAFTDVVTQNPSDPEGATKRAGAQAELNQQIRRVLGEARFAEYERHSDWAYRGARDTVQRHGLPEESAAAVLEMKHVAQSEAERLRADSTLSNEDRQRALNDVALAVEEAVFQLLGKDAYRTYRKHPGSSWITTLRPRPAR
jgi:hypothetical protein